STHHLCRRVQLGNGLHLIARGRSELLAGTGAHQLGVAVLSTLGHPGCGRKCPTSRRFSTLMQALAYSTVLLSSIRSRPSHIQPPSAPQVLALALGWDASARLSLQPSPAV